MSYHGQYQQDRIIHELFFEDMVTPGTFVEIGADDGVRFSNTLFFEKELGWKGLCVEPRPSIYGELIQNRNCICIQCAISEEDHSVVEFLEIEGYGRQLSGVVDMYDQRHRDRIARESTNPLFLSKNVVNLKTRRLDSLILELGFEYIHFLSIDTEGSEVPVLKSMGKQIENTGVILIENNYEQDYSACIPDLGKNFKLYKKILHDEIWVNNHFSSK